MDSLSTSNVAGGLNRMLVGQYSDPELGKVSAGAYSQFRPVDTSIKLEADAEFDSVVLQFRYDFYSYGTQGQTVQKYTVHEIAEELEFDDDHFFNSNVDIDPTSIGTAEANIDGQTFNTEFEDTDTDPVISTRIKLDNAFGQRLFNAIDPTATELAGLNSFFTDYFPASARYVQCGASLVTKLDISKYYDYIDTIPNIVINSAELVMGGVDPSSDYKPLSLISMAMLSPDNRYNTINTLQDTLDFISFKGKLIATDLGKQFASDDQGTSLFSMTYSSLNNSYSGFPIILLSTTF
ncbi:MAG: DUF4270 family protein [Flammeovirgaceae bacterium]|nr:DUF4270 family protein [Flammeovirgaceae bacterium]